MGWLDGFGLARVWARIRAALEEKQDRLSGRPGQVVGFGSDGAPRAQELSGGESDFQKLMTGRLG